MAFGSTKNKPNTAPEPSQGHLRQQEASKRGPREFQDESGGPLWSIQKPEGAPKSPPRASKRSPREPQNVFKTIFGSKMLIFQKSSSCFHKTTIFEGRRVGLGPQNRPQEAPRRDKKRHRKKKRENRRQEEHQERQKEF